MAAHPSLTRRKLSINAINPGAPGARLPAAATTAHCVLPCRQRALLHLCRRHLGRQQPSTWPAAGRCSTKMTKWDGRDPALGASSVMSILLDCLSGGRRAHSLPAMHGQHHRAVCWPGSPALSCTGSTAALWQLYWPGVAVQPSGLGRVLMEASPISQALTRPGAQPTHRWLLPGRPGGCLVMPDMSACHNWGTWQHLQRVLMMRGWQGSMWP